MKKTTALLAIAAALTLGGCTAGPASGSAADSTGASDPSSDVSPKHLELHVDLEDGRTVVCVALKRADGGGLSCDWAGAK